jgi:hypothetical protein
LKRIEGTNGSKFWGTGGPCLDVGERLQKGELGVREFRVKDTHKEAFVDGGDEIALEKRFRILAFFLG